MAGGFVTNTRQLLLQYFAAKGGITQPSVWAIALHTSNPGDSPTGFTGEVVTTGGTLYARVAINAIGGSSPAWNDATNASPSVLANLNVITFPTAGASWGTVTHFSVCSSTTVGSGNMIAYGALTGSVAVGIGVTASFAVGALTLTMDHT